MLGSLPWYYTLQPRGTHKWFGNQKRVAAGQFHKSRDRKMLINFEPLKLEKCLGLLFRMTISGRLVVECRGQDYQNKWVVLHEVKRGSLFLLCGLGIPSTGFHKTLCGLKSSFPALRSVRECWGKSIIREPGPYCFKLELLH